MVLSFVPRGREKRHMNTIQIELNPEISWSRTKQKAWRLFVAAIGYPPEDAKKRFAILN